MENLAKLRLKPTYKEGLKERPCSVKEQKIENIPEFAPKSPYAIIE